MEDSIEESESLVSHLNFDPKEGGDKEKAGDGKEVKAGLDDEERGVGTVKEEMKEGEGGVGGGIINQLISSLLKPKGEEDHEGEGKRGLEDEVGGVEEVKEEKKEEEGESGGGVINQFISNLLNSNGEEDEEKGKVELNDEERGIEQVKEEEKEEETGGVINNLLSNFPVSLPPAISDDVVPETGEASLLLSIIED
ncbi:hypothetical protein AAC387_Pa01g0654 [Persea americana]